MDCAASHAKVTTLNPYLPGFPHTFTVSKWDRKEADEWVGTRAIYSGQSTLLLLRVQVNTGV